MESVTEIIKKTLEDAKAKIPFIWGISIIETGDSYPYYSLVHNHCTPFKNMVFNSFEDLVEHIKNIPVKNEILYRQFNLKEDE